MSEPKWLDAGGSAVSRFDDADALEEGAEVVEMEGLAGAAALMRRVARRLRAPLGAPDPDTVFLNPSASSADADSKKGQSDE